MMSYLYDVASLMGDAIQWGTAIAAIPSGAFWEFA